MWLIPVTSIRMSQKLNLASLMQRNEYTCSPVQRMNWRKMSGNRQNGNSISIAYFKCIAVVKLVVGSRVQSL